MRILLDTHIALWAVTGSRRLSRKGQQLILDADEVHVSAATLWEIAIKHALAKGDMPASAAQALQAFRDAGYVLLTIKPEHAVRVERVRRHGRHALAHRRPPPHPGPHARARPDAGARRVGPARVPRRP